MRDNGSLPETEKVADALEREVGRFRGSSGAAEDAGELGGDQAVPAAIQLSEGLNSVQYAKHELEARLLKGKPIRSWIRELQVMWRDATGAQHSAFLKARDGKEQGRGASGFIQWMVIDGQEVAPPFYPGSSISASGGFKLLLAESRSRPGRVEDEFHLKIEGVVDLGVTARVAHPLMQTATEAQAHFNVHIVQLNTPCIETSLMLTMTSSHYFLVRPLLIMPFSPSNPTPDLSPPAHGGHSRGAWADLPQRGIPIGAVSVAPAAHSHAHLTSPPFLPALPPSSPTSTRRAFTGCWGRPSAVKHPARCDCSAPPAYSHAQTSPPFLPALLPTHHQHTEGIHGVLGQTFRSEASRLVRSLRHRLLTRLLREPVDVESSEVGDGLLDGIMQDYLTSGIAATDCVFSAAWRRGDPDIWMGDDGLDFMR
ncbi:unnamed protein product [Closterium sp. NIES-65]|nr:unnamed protein product [Closterium sp. NIES-65]